MKGSVIRPYIDKDTGKGYSAGDSVEYATDRARFLAEKGFLKIEDIPKAEPEIIPETAEAVEVPKPKKPRAAAKKKIKKQG